jgi:hypothetical protein
MDRTWLDSRHLLPLPLLAENHQNKNQHPSRKVRNTNSF